MITFLRDIESGALMKLVNIHRARRATTPEAVLEAEHYIRGFASSDTMPHAVTLVLGCLNLNIPLMSACLDTRTVIIPWKLREGRNVAHGNIDACFVKHGIQSKDFMPVYTPDLIAGVMGRGKNAHVNLLPLSLVQVEEIKENQAAIPELFVDSRPLFMLCPTLFDLKKAFPNATLELIDKPPPGSGVQIKIGFDLFTNNVDQPFLTMSWDCDEVQAKIEIMHALVRKKATWLIPTELNSLFECLYTQAETSAASSKYAFQ